MKWNEADWLMYYADECYVCIGQIIYMKALNIPDKGPLTPTPLVRIGT